MGYADDLPHLCPTAKGLQRMLNVCETFGEEFDMQFNPQISVCVCVGGGVCVSVYIVVEPLILLIEWPLQARSYPG